MAATESMGAGRTSLWSRVESLVRPLSRAVVVLLVGLIGLYQRFLSPYLRPRCRFLPSCSAYAAESLRKHGAAKGLLMGLWRVCRCHPLGKGGYDPP